MFKLGFLTAHFHNCSVSFSKCAHCCHHMLDESKPTLRRCLIAVVDCMGQHGYLHRIDAGAIFASLGHKTGVNHISFRKIISRLFFGWQG